MWLRYHIKCHGCDKTTNLRLHLTSQEKIDIKFNCPNENCRTELTGTLLIDYNKFKNYKPSFLTKLKSLIDSNADFRDFNRNFHDSLELKMSRGELVRDDFHGGDYYLEYSDGVRVSEPNSVGHNISTPILRQSGLDMVAKNQVDVLRKDLYPETNWKDLLDVIKAFQMDNIEGFIKFNSSLALNSELLDKKEFVYESELDRIHAYFYVTNHYLFLWIDPENHLKFVKFMHSTLLENGGLENQEFEQISLEYSQGNFYQKFKFEVNQLLSAFVKDRKLFEQTYLQVNQSEKAISNPNFEQLKSLYTDSFEFLGRNSPIIMKLMNIIERGTHDSMPTANLTIDGFARLNHGNRLDILKRSNIDELLEIYDGRYDHQLRNGINHFKTKFNTKTQDISYYPSTNNPELELKISYADFLTKTLMMIDSVMRMNQIVKMFFYHNRDRNL